MHFNFNWYILGALSKDYSRDVLSTEAKNNDTQFKGLKTIPFLVAHTYIAPYMGVPPGRVPSPYQVLCPLKNKSHSSLDCYIKKE